MQGTTQGDHGCDVQPNHHFKVHRRGHFDERISMLIERGLSNEQIAWELNDELIAMAEHEFLPVWEHTRGNGGHVSFELDPLIDIAMHLSHSERVSRYIELGQKWSAGHVNRMIKVPASPAGIGALEALAAAGVKINVTLIFTEQQYERARDTIWRGTRRRNSDYYYFKSVYRVFVSRIDVYTQHHVADLSSPTQGMVGIVHARRILRKNREFWRNKNLRLQQEIVFASTGVKNLYDPPDKYVQAFAGEGIITSSPATNEAVYDSPKVYNRRIDDMPPPSVIEEVDRRIDIAQMESRHLAEGTKTIAESQFPLLTLVAQKRASVFARAAATAGRRFRSDQVRICEQICGKPSPKGELYVQAILTSRSSAATDSPSLLSTPVYQTYRLLQVAFVVAPIVAGLDKFFHLLVDWDQYLAPVVPRVLGGHGHQFMLAVGVIEIVAGFGVLLKPKIFVSVVAAWLLGIIVNLLLIPGYYDVAVRDLGLCVAALALGRLSTEYDH